MTLGQVANPGPSLAHYTRSVPQCLFPEEGWCTYFVFHLLMSQRAPQQLRDDNVEDAPPLLRRSAVASECGS